MIYRFRKRCATGDFLSFNVCRLLCGVQSTRALFLVVSTVAMEIIYHRKSWLLLQRRGLESSVRSKMALPLRRGRKRSISCLPVLRRMQLN